MDDAPSSFQEANVDLVTTDDSHWKVRGGSSVMPVLATLVVAGQYIWIAVWNAWVIGVRGGDPSQTSDWLVNYAGGPVRRGLAGALLTASGDPHTVLWTTYAVQMGLLLAVCASGIALLWAAPRQTAWFMVALSPAFLLFPFLSPEGGLRKELIALAAFGLIALAYRFRWPVGMLAFPFLLFVIGAFSHESIPLTLPAFVYLVIRGTHEGIWQRGAGRVVGGLFALAAVAGLAWSMTHVATDEHITTVCESWMDMGLHKELCSGTLPMLGDSPIDALRMTVSMFPSYFSLVPLMVLALVPFYAVRAGRQVRLLALVVFAALVPLFVVGIDYGRWVFVGVSLLSMLSLAMSRTEQFRPREVPWWAGILFVSLWGIPYTGSAAGLSLLTQMTTSIYDVVSQWLADLSGFGR